MKKILLVILLVLAQGKMVSAQESDLLQCGPMVGYSEMMEVQLWVQTRGPAEVQILYRDQQDAGTTFRSASVKTTKETGFTAKLLADEVKPGRKYDYAVYVNGTRVSREYPMEFQTPVLWQWRTAPPEFTLALGSCAYINEATYDRPGTPYGGDYEIFESIHRLAPDVMLWLGDNVYMREVDWNTRTGQIHRYTHSRSIAQLQPLLASTHHYAIWDDHDGGPNNTNRSQWNLDTGREAFELFWANPSYGVDAMDHQGLTTYFEWADIDFFLLDNRSFRAPNDRITGEPTVLGEEQIQWLMDALATSQAPFKLVAMGGQFLNPVAVHENYSNVAPGERDRIIRLLRQEGIEGVIFLTGDRHHSEITKLEEEGYPPLYDLTFSTLTAGVHTQAVDEPNYLREPDTLVTERNFGLIRFTGGRGDRRMNIACYGTTGNLLWEYTIHENDVK